MEFEWDENKAAANLSKHNVSFPYATKVFFDPNRTVREIIKEEHGEIRYKSIGKAGGEVLAVVHTSRGDDCRIISARRASKNERKEYGKDS